MAEPMEDANPKTETKEEAAAPETGEVVHKGGATRLTAEADWMIVS
jgi:hypothetical protein